MKFIAAFLAITAWWGCNHSMPPAEAPVSPPPDAPVWYLSLSDAEKIIGEEARMIESLTEEKTGVSIYKCAYKAKAEDPETGKTGGIYYLFEQYEQADSASAVYTSIYRSNADHEGVEVLRSLGDEAYFHSDGQNFCFIMVRKGTKMIRLKVNKITGHTSLDDFHAVAAKLTALL